MKYETGELVTYRYNEKILSGLIHTQCGSYNAYSIKPFDDSEHIHFVLAHDIVDGDMMCPVILELDKL